MKKSLSLSFVILVSWIALLVERLWISFWAFISFFCFAVALSVIGFWLWLPAFLHAALLGFSFLFLLYLAVKGYRQFTLPRRHDAERAIEKESGLLHRPLSLLNDRPVTGDDAIWQLSQEQMRLNSKGRIKFYKPRPLPAEKDRHGLRHAAFLMLIISLFIMKFPSPQIVASKLLPKFQVTAATAAGIEAWITPPDYTNKSPVFLLSQKMTVPALPETLEVPDGSILHIRASGFRLSPSLSIADKSVRLEKDDKGFLTTDQKLTKDGKLKIRQMFTNYVSVDLHVVKDSAPALTLLAADPAPGGMVRLNYEAKDDYGIKQLTGTLSAQDRHGNPIERDFDLPLPAKKDKITSLQDFTSLPEAGKSVSLTLTAEDGAGNRTTSQSLPMVLPERHFTSKVAQNLIQARKRLIGYEDPITRHLAIDDIVQAARKPADYNGDYGLFLGMVAALNRLTLDDTTNGVDTTIPLLWDMAVKLEDGGLNDAALTATQALQNLQDALADKNATAEELQRLVAAAQTAMQKYLQSLAGQMQQRMLQGQKPLMVSSELASRLMKSVDIGQMIKQMQAMGQTGSRDMLQKMAQQMQQSLQSLDPTRMGQMSEDTEAALQALDQLPGLIRDQQFILDRTRFLKEREKDADLTEAQGLLSRELSGLLKDLGQVLQVPGNLFDAEKSMKDAQSALAKGQNAAAIKAETEALEQLQKGTEQATQNMAEALQQQMIMMPGGQSQNAGGKPGQDPLGRGGMGDQTNIELPAEQEQSRIQNIIRELRDRSNEYQRPQQERDYIDRLLDTFN